MRRLWLALLLIVVTACSSRQAAPSQPTAGERPSLTAPAGSPSAVQATTGAATAGSTPSLTSPVTPQPSLTRTSLPSATLAPTPAPAVLIGAGDIAYCGDAPEYQGDERTAAIVQSMLKDAPGATVMTVGDTVYGSGTRTELKDCFDPSWGQFKDRIRPALGNHDIQTENGAPYFDYFGAAAGPVGKGYYSYNLGSWHIVVLNSNCNDIACTPDSQQVKWLREDLQQNQTLCTLAYWHHPRWSSGLGGGGAAATFWKTAAELGVDVVVSGHDHDYERFAPMNAGGDADPQGTREFVVGTGGATLRPFGRIKTNSEVRIAGTHGVIQFSLYPDHYQWQFVPAEEPSMTDQGTGACH